MIQMHTQLLRLISSLHGPRCLDLDPWARTGLVDSRASPTCVRPVLDLDYEQDFAAAVDMNVVMTGAGRFVEIQGTGEEATFDDDELAALLKLARRGIGQLTEFQRTALGKRWPQFPEK